VKGQTKKLARLWKGPFRIHQVSRDGLNLILCTVRNPHRTKPMRVHVNRVKLAYPSVTTEGNTPSNEQETPRDVNDTETAEDDGTTRQRDNRGEDVDLETNNNDLADADEDDIWRNAVTGDPVESNVLDEETGPSHTPEPTMDERNENRNSQGPSTNPDPTRQGDGQSATTDGTGLAPALPASESHAPAQIRDPRDLELVVWAKVPGWPYWPGMIIPDDMIPDELRRRKRPAGSVPVRFFEDDQFAYCPAAQVYDYAAYRDKFAKCRRAVIRRAIEKADSWISATREGQQTPTEQADDDRVSVTSAPAQVANLVVGSRCSSKQCLHEADCPNNHCPHACGESNSMVQTAIASSTAHNNLHDCMVKMPVLNACTSQTPSSACIGTNDCTLHCNKSLSCTVKQQRCPACACRSPLIAHVSMPTNAAKTVTDIVWRKRSLRHWPVENYLNKRHSQHWSVSTYDCSTDDENVHVSGPESEMALVIDESDLYEFGEEGPGSLKGKEKGKGQKPKKSKLRSVVSKPAKRPHMSDRGRGSGSRHKDGKRRMQQDSRDGRKEKSGRKERRVEPTRHHSRGTGIVEKRREAVAELYRVEPPRTVAANRGPRPRDSFNVTPMEKTSVELGQAEERRDFHIRMTQHYTSVADRRRRELCGPGGPSEASVQTDPGAAASFPPSLFPMQQEEAMPLVGQGSPAQEQPEQPDIWDAALAGGAEPEPAQKRGRTKGGFNAEYKRHLFRLRQLQRSAAGSRPRHRHPMPPPTRPCQQPPASYLMGPSPWYPSPQPQLVQPYPFGYPGYPAGWCPAPPMWTYGGAYGPSPYH
jgi:hypothetical protein